MKIKHDLKDIIEKARLATWLSRDWIDMGYGDETSWVCYFICHETKYNVLLRYFCFNV